MPPLAAHQRPIAVGCGLLAQRSVVDRRRTLRLVVRAGWASDTARFVSTAKSHQACDHLQFGNRPTVEGWTLLTYLAAAFLSIDFAPILSNKVVRHDAPGRVVGMVEVAPPTPAEMAVRVGDEVAERFMASNRRGGVN